MADSEFIMEKWATAAGLTKASTEKLISEEIDCKEDLVALSKEDIAELGLPIGQRN